MRLYLSIEWIIYYQYSTFSLNGPLYILYIRVDIHAIDIVNVPMHNAHLMYTFKMYKLIYPVVICNDVILGHLGLQK